MAQHGETEEYGASARSDAMDGAIHRLAGSDIATRSVRVRFAPSPTGALHIGNVRSALFNYFFARHSGGEFILRIDDTDRARDVPDAVAAILRDLRLLGLSWDEGPDIGGPCGPYVQSHRKHLYLKPIKRLLRNGSAYRCYCTREELAARKVEQKARGDPPRYDRRCTRLSRREVRALAGAPSVVRLRLPDEIVRYTDLVYGALAYDLRHADDLMLTRSNGSVLYDLASIVDDQLMGITHILRGDTWLSTTPAHIALFRALGWEPPTFAHLPQIVGPDRKKLAKRHGARSLRALLDDDYLPETLQNGLALLGWSPGGDREVLSPVELVARFGLDRVQRSPALFDMDRLDWLNGMHVRQLDLDDLVSRCLPYIRAAGLLPTATLSTPQRDHLRDVLALCRDRLHTLSETADLVRFFYSEPEGDQGLLLERGPDAPAAAALLVEAATAMEQTAFTAPTLERALRDLAARRECSTGRLFWLVRVAATGCRAAPPLFAVLALLGSTVALNRLRRAAADLGGVAAHESPA